jgi:thymidine kinase
MNIPHDVTTAPKVIIIEEAQFFDDLLVFARTMVESFGKIVVVVGLDGDSNRKPFGQILECIPLCDNIIKLTAMDMIDKDGTEAIFSKRIIIDDQQISVGATDKYIAVSRKNYLRDL